MLSWRSYLSSLSSVKLILSPLCTLYSLEGKLGGVRTYTLPHGQTTYIDYSAPEFWLPFSNSLSYLCHYGLEAICLILYITIQYCLFIFLLKLFQLWPLKSLQWILWPFDILAIKNVFEHFCDYIRALQDSPGMYSTSTLQLISHYWFLCMKIIQETSEC